MNKEQDDESAEKESNNYLWIAGFLVGGILILMLLVIVGIILWKHFKKQNTADQTWAGPPPLADDHIQEDGASKMDRCILGNMPLPCISSTEILPKEPRISQDRYLGEETIERKTADTAAISTLSISPPVPMSQVLNEHLTENDSNKETFPPPPPHILQEFPMPLQSDFAAPDLEENSLQPPPLLNYAQQDEDSTQMTLNPLTGQLCDINISHNDTFDDQLLPPPPADFL